MSFAREAAQETQLPAEIWAVVEATFRCSCEVVIGYEELTEAVIGDLAQRSDHSAAEELRERLSMYRAVGKEFEEGCADDPETLIVQRFQRWLANRRNQDRRKSRRFFQGDPRFIC
jgi:hypothetical protein